MSKKLAVVLVSLLCIPGLAPAKEIAFGPEKEISISDGAQRAVNYADIDGDGDLDLITASGLNTPSGAYWYENLDGEGDFSAARIIGDCSDTLSLCNAFLPEMADMDGDGDLDAVTGNPNLLAWYENLDGAGNFGPQNPIRFDNGANLYDVEVGDLDRDGDLDVVASSYNSNKVAWYENLGGGAFAGPGISEILIGTGLSNPRGVKLADLNRDGLLDVIVASSSASSVIWFANLGSGTFGGQQIISSTTPAVYDVDVADVDGDGNLDVVSVAGALSSSGVVRWYENVNDDGSNWNETIVFSGSGASTVIVDVADMDDDGDSDLLTTWFGDSGRVAWYENGNAGTSWVERVISNNLVRYGDSLAADLDGDGDLDVASGSVGPSPQGSSPSEEKLVWYENRTIHRSVIFPSAATVTPEAGPGALNPVAVGDVDRDGDPDVVFGFYGEPNRIYLNNGTPDPWSGVAGSDIGTELDPTHEVVLGDFDGDGDLDFVSGSNGAPARLYLNNGTADPFNGVAGIAMNDGGQTFSMKAGDIDGDLDLDLVIGSCCSVPLRVMLNNGTSDPFNGVTPLSYASFDAKALSLGDFDRDGDLDLVQSGEEGQGSQIRLNNGTADPFNGVTATMLGTDTSRNLGNVVGDVDADGDLDIVIAGASLLLYLNNGTADPFQGVAGTVIPVTDAQGSVALALSDVDADGDLDLVRTAYFIVPQVYLNNGTATPFQGVTPTNLASLVTDSRSTVAIDIDGDGKLDVVTGNTTQNPPSQGVKWYRNTGGQFRVNHRPTAANGILYEGEESALMAVTLTLLGRSGDPVGRLDTMELNFRDLVPLTTAQAAALISELRIYRDNGDLSFDAGSDTLITATTMNLTSGVQTVQLPADDPNTRIAAPATFFVVAAMSPTASTAPLTTFRMDYSTSSRVVDTIAGIRLESENPLGGLTVPPFTALGRFVVDSTNDEDDTSPGDGICSSSSGVCTLRAAVEEANLRSGSDLIIVSPGLGSYVLTGALTINDPTAGSLTIRAEGSERAVIDGGGVDRVFVIDNGSTAEFENLTIRNGSVAANLAGGGIVNIGSTLTLDNCEVVSNIGGNGGGLAGVASSTTTIRNSSISNNTSLASGGGLAVITSSQLDLQDSVVADNAAASSGGAIFVLFDGSMKLANSTISRNDNPPAGGAAIVGDSGAGAGSGIDSVTIAGNTNGGLSWYGPTLTVRNSIIADNGVDLGGPPNIASQGHNLIGNRGTNPAFVDGVNNDQVGDGANPILPLLSPLGDYGGSTLSQALEAGSPAIDAGVCSTLVTDQRGEARPVDAPAIANVTDGCDIGAYEALLGNTEARLEVPVRWCGVRGAPSIEDPGLLGAASVNDLLRGRHERASESIYTPQGNIAFRSAANFIVESYPVLEDPDCTETSPGSGVYTCTHGERGDVYINPEEANFFEFQQLIASCREAWQAQDPTITGLTVVHINRFVDGNGTPLEVLGLGGRAEPGDIAEQSAAGRVMVVDNFYRQSANPEDLVDRLLGHELGHALSLRHGDGIDNDEDGILDNDDEKTRGIPRFDGPNLMQYRSGTELTTDQLIQLRSHIVFAVPDIVVQPTVDSATNSSPIDEERARILEFGYGEVVDLERARILEFAEGSPLEFERARILEFERARLLEFERARLLEFENARILEFGMTYTGETATDSAVLVASTGSLPWPAPIRPTTSYYYYLDLDRSDATGGYPATSANPGDPGNNFPGTDVVQSGGDITEEFGVDLIAEIVLESSCPADVCSSTATLLAYDYNDTTGVYELVFSDPSPTITAKGVGLYIDNGGDPVDLDDAPIGMTLQPRIPNSVLFAAGWGFQTDPGTGAQVPNPVKMEVVSTIECDGRILNDDPNTGMADCQCMDCNVCPDYPGCAGTTGTPVTLTGKTIPTDAQAGELPFVAPVLPKATVSPLMAEEGQTVNVFITDLPTDITGGNVEVTLNGALLTPPIPTSEIAPNGSITVPVELPLGQFGDLTLSAGITGFAPRANAVVNVTPALACPDNDGDGICDIDDADDDNDGVADANDLEPFNSMVCSDTDTDTCDDCSSGTFNPASDGPDYDMDGACDDGDADDDNDGVDDTGDLSPFDAMSCLDADLDGCDDCSGPLAGADPSNDGADADADGICDLGDTCPNDVDNDVDSDSVCGDVDNCPATANAAQDDTDSDLLGDACDTCPADANNDIDGDSVCGDVDNCPAIANAAQGDTDSDLLGDACDTCPADANNDVDTDSVCGDVDNCPSISNSGQTDVDNDLLGDVCDSCPADADNDIDGDSVCGDVDNCPAIANTAQGDTDSDLLGDACDTCPADANNDIDGDSVCGDVDNCPAVANATQDDTDSDLLGDACDTCPADADNDIDGDLVCGDVDNCPAVANATQDDADADLLGDACDACPADANNDIDGDSVCGDVDNCPATANPTQDDTDSDLLGDACDADDDNDGVRDSEDSDPLNSMVCSDTDTDTCEDCSSGTFNPASDGLDFDGDGLCDAGDPDDDNDGVDDGLDPASLDFDLCGDTDLDTCDDCSVGTDNDGPDTDADPFNDGPDTDADGVCDAGSSCPQGADIRIVAQKHLVGGGSNPGSSKEPLVGIEVCAYDSSQGSCASDECGGTSHRDYTCIATGDGTNGPCDTAMCCTTDATGECTIHVVPGDYVVISDDATKTVLPDPLGVSAGGLACGDDKTKRLQQIVKANGKKVPGKTTRMTGSELLIIEPEFVVWEETQELYPFIFETIGDWTVTATVTPPEGFVADHDALTADVDNELEVVQFVITEVGSDLVPTQTTFDISHGSRTMVVRGNVDLYLTPEYARSRGFAVRELRARGLIREKNQVAREARPDIPGDRKTASQRAWEAGRNDAAGPGQGTSDPGRSPQR